MYKKNPSHLFKLFISLALQFCMTTMVYANSAEDFGRIVLNTYIAPNANIPNEARLQLENKLSQIASSNGMGGCDANPRFIITAKINVLTKDIIPGPPQMIAQNLEITVYIGDGIDNILFSSSNITLKGVGINENKAYIDAIKKINVKSKEIENCLNEGKNKIIEYYATNCKFLINEAMSLSNKGEYDAAMAKLAVVPQVCGECYFNCLDTLQYIFQQKINKECLVKMREAKARWMAGQDKAAADAVGEIISGISPFSTCEPDVSDLMGKIESKLKADEKAAWDLKVKKYEDHQKQKKEALRIQEEEIKNNQQIKEDALKREYQLQKESQRQNYSLQKSEQSSGGMKGVIYAVAKLKQIFINDAAASHIAQNKPKADYSKVNF
jgi:hypothetical protein